MEKSELIIWAISVAVLVLVMVLATGMFVVCVARIQNHEERLADVESRLENIAEGGREINRQLRDTNKRIDNIIKQL